MTYQLIDTTSLRIKAMVSSEGDHLADAHSVASIVWNQAFPPTVRGMPLAPEIGGPLLHKYTNLLQHRLAALLRGHSAWYWSHHARRIGPGKYPEENYTDGWLNYVTFQLACLRFGEDDLSDMCIADESSLSPVSFSASEFRALFLALHLSRYLARAYATLRTVWKGAAIVAGADRQYELDASDDFWTLIRLYDDRRFNRTSGNFLSVAGLSGDVEVGSFLRDHCLLLPVLNVDQIRYSNFDVHTPEGAVLEHSDDVDFNYAPFGVHLGIYEDLAGLFDDEMQSMWGVTAHEVVTVLEALSAGIARRMLEDIHAQYTVLQRGWYVLSYDDPVVRSVAEMCVYMHPDENPNLDSALDVVMRVLDCFRAPPCTAIDLCARGPFPLARKIGGFLFIDLWLALHFLTDLVTSLPWESMGAAGNRRGQLFEDQVALAVAQANLNQWTHPRILKITPNCQREADIVVLRGTTLFLVECRSSVTPPAIDRGEPTYLQRRLEGVVHRKLDQADSLRLLLAKHPKGLNYELPRQVKRIVSVACAPYPEWLPARDDYYFCADGTPRFLTPAELVALIRAFDPADHIGRPYCSPV